MSRPIGFGAVSSRETSENELRAKARDKVIAAARRGESPREFFTPEDLEWARLTPDELDALEQEAQEAIRQHTEAHRRAQRTRALRHATDQVLAEQDAERRRQAEAEARRRLGWEDEAA